MPFVSQAQRAKFYADPELRRYVPEFEAATHGPLPARVAPKPKKKLVRVKSHVRANSRRKQMAAPNAHARPGAGGRFAAMVASGKSPALAAYIGRKKYGKGRFQHMASEGRRRALHKMGAR